MGAPDLIFELRSNGYSIKADGQYLDISPADDLSDELVQQLKQSKVAILAALKLEQQQKARREKVLAMLDADPATKRAIHADTDSDPGNVILTIAIRHAGTCEMTIPKVGYEPFELFMILDNLDKAANRDH